MRISYTTLGCKVNQYETSAIEKMLAERGHEVCAEGDIADAVIINTCAVTAESGRKSRQAVRKAKRENPNALVAVCGCFSQISPEEIDALGADMVYGSGQRVKFVEDFDKLIMERHTVNCIDNPFKRREFEMLPSGGLAGRTRAMLKIQDGCDNFCTFCIIPFARGAVRSMPIEQAVNEAIKLRSDGYKEIVITGIEIASYGKDLKDGSNLADVIAMIGKAVPDVRIRLGSIEPRVITEEFCQKISVVNKLCPQFHLSMQSGCDETLKRMGRKYDASEYLNAVNLLKRYFDHSAITTDMIVGFPGETEEEFASSLEFIQKCGFSDMHIFPYSIRQGTRAASMSGHIDKKVKSERAKRASEVAKVMKQKYLAECIGREMEVLIEREDTEGNGHAENYCLVKIPACKRGDIVKVKILDVTDEILVAERHTSV